MSEPTVVRAPSGFQTLDGVTDQLAYHPATPEVAATFASLRSQAMMLAEGTWHLIPDGPEKTLAYRHLQQFLMYANLAVALTTPSDYANAHVARVLPSDPEQS